MLVYKLLGSSSLSNFYAKYVALSQSTRHLVIMKTLVSEVVKVIGQDTKKLEFITHSTVTGENYGPVNVNHNHKLPMMTPG